MKKALPALLCAVGLLCATGAQAAGTYIETALPFAKSAHETRGKMALLAKDGGIVDYVYQGKERTARELDWFHSADGGKTWSAKDTSWYGPIVERARKQIEEENDAIQKKWGGDYEVTATDAGSIGSMLLADDGSLYCMINTGKKAFRYTAAGYAKKGYSSYDMLQVFKAADGKAAAIPHLELYECDIPSEDDGIDGLEYKEYRLVGAGTNGKIYVRVDARNPERSGRGTFRFQVYDEETGKLLSETKALDAVNAYEFCGVGKTAYLLETGADGWTLLAYDMETGERTRSVALPSNGEEDGYAASVCARGGSVYVTASSGLYRLDPGADAFTKLADGSVCRFGADARCGVAACTESGTVYLPVYYYAAYGDAVDMNFREGHLYRYSPK